MRVRISLLPALFHAPNPRPGIGGKYATPDGVIIKGQPCARTRRDNQARIISEEMMGDWLICAAIYVLIAVNIIDMGRKRKS